MIKRLLSKHLPKPGQAVILSETEAHHAIHVLRIGDSDLIELLDGAGKSAIATLKIKDGIVTAEFTKGESSIPERIILKTQPLVLEMAILKRSAMEWVIEKSVELGVDQLVPVITDRSVVQLKDKHPETFQNRWEKIADQALKQCGRLYRMKVKSPIKLSELDQRLELPNSYLRLWCDELRDPKLPHILKILKDLPLSKIDQLRILIGPEGGWSNSERQLLMKSPHTFQVELGPTIMRAETAALYSVSAVSAYLSILPQ
jgi:16S rRNA (uracil1498-N3)-methyltransferase